MKENAKTKIQEIEKVMTKEKIKTKEIEKMYARAGKKCAKKG